MAKIRFVPIETVLELTENNESFKLVEVLDEQYYQKGHLPGAVNIPVGQLEQRAQKELSKSEIIVVYCANYHCSASTGAAKQLISLGYNHVLDFKAGKKGWEDAGLPLVK